MAKKLKKSKNTGRTKYPSWLTTDKHEVELRQKRALTEPMIIKRKINEVSSFFTDYSVKRKDVPDPQEYRVEIRSINEHLNYCNCPDFHKNFLGTCKHIEKIIAKCKSSAKKNKSPFIEIFLDYSNDAKLKVLYPEKPDRKATLFMTKYLDRSKNLKKPVNTTLQVLLRDIETADPVIFNYIRISDAVVELNKENIMHSNMKRIEQQHKAQIREAAMNGKFLKYPLYDYQVDGMLHLAFNGRAMLADEMGLGKTVQAVAAAALMQEYLGVKRVMVVSPTSLKTEWEEQIEKFTKLPSKIVIGTREDRLNIYKNGAEFFILTNYEQILRDYEDINHYLQPDLIILDEAQRIKNWKTKTALNIKRLNSKYAFILTGTPIENRIDELYSLTEFVDPKIFGELIQIQQEIL